ncbi:hypothetical protein So717_25670 [Roseobacter cerasinus]|uniref:Uncharacterized protein n=1 Tax=Roseobacter cerasinus TaxID=2602289 RepID=A0A640VT87_9RHOB|nr:hypothetical protein [Roseobacter cerasinus]GFE50814.1 hypothetical protein So717_25670 [Roseobacter cerasinus]
MVQDSLTETSFRKNVLNLEEGDIAAFVRKCVKDRSLSKVVGHLNNDMLFGTHKERREAEEALHRLGFL